MRRLRKWPAVVALCALLAGCARADAGTLTAVFYDVGKADAILLYTDNAAVLIDAGEDEAGERIAADIGARGIERLDVMIITHFDKDHVGGADKVLEGMQVDRVLEPSYEKDSKQVRQYRDALDDAGVAAEALSENASFALSGLLFDVDVANENFYGEDEENDFSLVVRLTHADVRFLFAGDAENPRLIELIDEGDLKSDVLKVPYHGNHKRMNAPFFVEVSPEIAVITSSDDEMEDERTVVALEDVGARVLLTREGTVEIVSDGKRAEEIR